ncbi:MAG: twin-arginine translocase subunit TatC [Planctomycetota bacterium]
MTENDTNNDPPAEDAPPSTRSEVEAAQRDEPDSGADGLFGDGMSFGAHLEDLRRRLILGLGGLVPIVILAFVFGQEILAWLVEPLRDQLRAAEQPVALIQTGPAEAVMIYIKIALVTAVIAGAPWLLFQLWKFIEPGLYANEKKFVYVLIPFSGVLTVGSVAFLYYATLPLMLGYLIYFGTHIVQLPGGEAEPPPGVTLPSLIVLDGDPAEPEIGQYWFNEHIDQLRFAAPQLGDDDLSEPPRILGAQFSAGTGIIQQYKVSEYVNTIFSLAIGFAIGFQMPIVVLLLGWSGIIERAFFEKYRKYMVLVCAIAGALLTPADPGSMFMLAVPLYLLFEVGIVLLRFFPPSYERERSREPSDGAPDA